MTDVPGTFLTRLWFKSITWTHLNTSKIELAKFEIFMNALLNLNPDQLSEIGSVTNSDKKSKSYEKLYNFRFLF
jgi:hypothetical protein